MSQCNQEYTKGFVWTNQREQAGFTRAIVEISLKSNLTDAQRTTVAKFEDIWLAGRDFTLGKTFDWFIAACNQHNVPIRFMKKPSRKRGGGAMFETVWIRPEPMGSFWPPYTNKDKTKRSPEQIAKLKADYRVKVMHDHMKQLGIRTLDYRVDRSKAVQAMVDAKVVATVEAKLATLVQPTPVPTETVSTNVVPLRPIPDEIDFGTCSAEPASYPYMNDNERIAA